MDHYFLLGGTDIATQTSSSNVATIIVTLKPWDERKAPNEQLPAILAAAGRGLSQVPEAFTFAFGLPPILGLSLPAASSSCWKTAPAAVFSTLGQVADSLVDATRQNGRISPTC